MLNLIRRLLCAVGLHRWGPWYRHFNYFRIVEQRICQRCYVKETRYLGYKN